MILEPYRSRSLNVLLAALGMADEHEFELLARNFYGGWGEENLELTLEDGPVGMDADLLAAKKQVVSHQAYSAEPFHNGQTLALKAWSYDGEKLKASFVASDYFSFLAYDEMEKAEGHIPLGCSALAVGIYMVTKDNLVVLTQRARTTYRGGERSFSFGETLSMGEVRGSNIDAVGGAQRGAREEMGLGLKRGGIVFTGFGVNRRHANSTLWGLAHLQEEWSELWLDDRWEIEQSKAVPFRVEEVMQELTQGQWEYAAALGLLEVLIYQYGMEAVFEAAGVKVNAG